MSTARMNEEEFSQTVQVPLSADAKAKAQQVLSEASELMSQNRGAPYAQRLKEAFKKAFPEESETVLREAIEHGMEVTVKLSDYPEAVEVFEQMNAVIDQAVPLVEGILNQEKELLDYENSDDPIEL